MATYYNDCTSLTGWAEVGLVAATQFSSAGSNITYSATSAGELLEFLSAYSENTEVYGVVSVNNIGTTNIRVAHVRGTGTTTATSAYYAIGIRSTAVRLYKQQSNAFTQLISFATTITANTQYKYRLRANGTTIQVKWWLATDSEPGAWTIDTTDSSISGVGSAGFAGNGSTGDVLTFTGFGASTAGETAPTSAGGGGTVAASMVSAAGVSSVSIIASSIAAGSFTAANGVSTVSIVGSSSAAGASSFVAASGTSSVSIVGSSVASGSFSSALGTSTASILGSSVKSANFITSAGTSVVSLTGGTVDLKSTILPANGLATVAMTGSAVIRASFIPAAGLSTVAMNNIPTITGVLPRFRFII